MSAMLWLLIPVLVLGSAYLLLRRHLSRPLLREGLTRDRFAHFAENLLVQGAHGTQLVIRPDGSDVELKIAKTIEPASDRRLQLLFPDAPWSREQYPKVKRALAMQGIPYTERQWHEPPIERLLFVLHVNGSDDAARIARIAFDAMGVSADQTFTLYYEGGASFVEWKRHLEQFGSEAAGDDQ